MPYSAKDVTAATAAVNREAVARYDMDERQDFLDADRGFVASFPEPVIGPDGHVIFDAADYESIADEGLRGPGRPVPSARRSGLAGARLAGSRAVRRRASRVCCSPPEPFGHDGSLRWSRVAKVRAQAGPQVRPRQVWRRRLAVPSGSFRDFDSLGRDPRSD
jgi:hypothetical protein